MHVQWHVTSLQTGTSPNCFNCQLRFCFRENHISRVALSFSLISCWGVHMNKYLILIFIVLRQFKCSLNVTTTCISLQQYKPTFSKFHIKKLCFSIADVKITNKFPHLKFLKISISHSYTLKRFWKQKVKSCLHWVYDKTMDYQSYTCVSMHPDLLIYSVAWFHDQNINKYINTNQLYHTAGRDLTLIQLWNSSWIKDAIVLGVEK